MRNTSVSSSPLEPRTPPRAGRELRRALVDTWDHLGLACGVSLTFFTITTLPPASALATRHAGWAAAAALWIPLVGGPLWLGACHVAHRICSRDEPHYGALWTAAARHGGQAAALALVQVAVSVILVADALFFATREFAGSVVLAAMFGYALFFWGMNCIYHWPLLVAAQTGVIARPDGGPPRLRSAMRNAFVIVLSAPGFTSVFLLTIMAVAVGFAATGVGLALLGAGLVSILCTTAARAQMVRFGALPEPPDLDGAPTDVGWRVS